MLLLMFKLNLCTQNGYNIKVKNRSIWIIYIFTHLIPDAAYTNWFNNEILRLYFDFNTSET